MNISRRAFHQAAVAGLAPVTRLFGAKRIPIAVQLYSVRQIAQNDLAGVLAQTAKLGYEGVEFAGYYGHDAAAIRKMLDDNGLKVAGTHIQLDTLLGDNLPKTLEFNRTIGNKNLIVPGLAAKYRNSIEAWKDTATIFNEISHKVRPQGFVVGYHNHTAEFEKIGGAIPFDVFFQATKPEVKVQLDIGHARRAGADPEKVIRRYKGRVISVHVKEYAPDKEDVPLGEGAVDWKKVFAALESVGGTEWYIVEEEAKTCEGFSCVARSMERLKKMKKTK